MQKQTNDHQTNFTKWLNAQLGSVPDNLSTIAKKADLTLPYLSMLKSGKRSRPSRKTVEKLAHALGADLNEALAAANLPLSHGALPQPAGRKGSYQSLASDKLPPADWLWRVKAGRVSLQAEVKQVEEKTFQVCLKQVEDGAVEPTKPCYVRWFTHGKEQAVVVASVEGVTFTLRSGEHELRCRRADEEEEVVFGMYIGIRRIGNAEKSKPDIGN